MKKIIKISFSLCLSFLLSILFFNNVFAVDESYDDLSESIVDTGEWMKKTMENMNKMNARLNISADSLNDMTFWSIWHKLYDMLFEYSDYLSEVSKYLNLKWADADRFYHEYFDQDTWNILRLWSYYNGDSKFLILWDWLNNSNNLKDFYLWTWYVGLIDVETFNKIFDFWKFFRQFETDFVYKVYVWYLSYEFSEAKEINYSWLRWLIYRLFLMNSERKLLDKIPGSSLVNPLPSEDYNVAYRRWKYLMNDFKRKFMCDYDYNKHMNYYYCDIWIYFEQSRNYMLKNEILNRFIFGISLLLFLLIWYYKKSNKSYLWKIYRYFLLVWLIIILYASSTGITYNTVLRASVWTSILTFRFACLIYLLIKRIFCKLTKNKRRNLDEKSSDGNYSANKPELTKKRKSIFKRVRFRLLIILVVVFVVFPLLIGSFFYKNILNSEEMSFNENNDNFSQDSVDFYDEFMKNYENLSEEYQKKIAKSQEWLNWSGFNNVESLKNVELINETLITIQEMQGYIDDFFTKSDDLINDYVEKTNDYSVVSANSDLKEMYGKLNNVLDMGVEWFNFLLSIQDSFFINSNGKVIFYDNNIYKYNTMSQNLRNAILDMQDYYREKNDYYNSL